MELAKILSIAGKPGLYQILHQARGSVVVASLTDGRKISIGQTQRVSALSDISVYKEDGDEPLENIFSKMLEYNGGKAIEIEMKDNGALRSFFLEILPDHDEERVYASDIKKLVKWFNTLVEKNLLSIPADSTPESPAEETKAPVKAKKTAKPKKAAKPKNEPEA